MTDLNNLYYFAYIVDYKGFAPASRALGIPKSTLSRRMSQLETELGVRLIQRSSRHFTVTDIGQRYYEHCRAVLIEADAARDAVESLRAEPCGVVKLTCPIGLLNFHVGELLARYMALHPEVTIHLEATNRRVDVIAEGVDVAIRVRPRPLEDSDLALRVLSDRGQCLVASPELVARMSAPRHPGDLAAWPSLSRSTPSEPHVWILHDAGNEEVRVEHTPRYVTTDMTALLRAALAGVGLVQLPALMLAQYLKDGALIEVLPDWSPRREVIHAVFPSRRGMLPSVRSLIDFLVEAYREIDED